jgi:hypothetical protein
MICLSDFEVLDPPELAAEIRRLAERFTRAVTDPETRADERGTVSTVRRR